MNENNGTAANRRPDGESGGSGKLSAIIAAVRAFPAAVAELTSEVIRQRFFLGFFHWFFKRAFTQFDAVEQGHQWAAVFGQGGFVDGLLIEGGVSS
ncbi:MAG: hypothetical protein ABSE16_21135 [Verrucomicrobiota bacterium]